MNWIHFDSLGTGIYDDIANDEQCQYKQIRSEHFHFGLDISILN